MRKGSVWLHLCAPAFAPDGGPGRPEAACAVLAGPRPAPSSRRSCGLLRPYSHRSPTRDCAGNEYFATTARGPCPPDDDAAVRARRSGGPAGSDRATLAGEGVVTAW